jgi:inosine-uridine nucleoside N-ribohydrolase
MALAALTVLFAAAQATAADDAGNAGATSPSGSQQAQFQGPRIPRRDMSLIAMPAAQVRSGQPVKLIFDTDIGNDVDDTMALAMIHALIERHECELLAVTISKDNRFTAPLVDLVNHFYGHSNIPIGMVRGGVTTDDGKYLRQVVEWKDGGALRYPRRLKDGSEAPEAVALLRKTLAGQPDHSVVIAMVGFSTNMARLLDSKADDASPLDGKALVTKKVRLLSAMAGEYAGRRFKEYNVVTDLPAARKVFAEWPTPVLASGFEVGELILHPGRSMADDLGYVKHHPLQDAYALYRGSLANDQPTWDLTSVFYAARPNRGYFGLSEPGRITVDAEGVTNFHKEAGGPHRYMTVTPEQIVRVREAFALLCSEPPRQPAKAIKLPRNGQ